jgi:hypothetical protein
MALLSAYAPINMHVANRSIVNLALDDNLDSPRTNWQRTSKPPTTWCSPQFHQIETPPLPTPQTGVRIQAESYPNGEDPADPPLTEVGSGR